MARLVSLAHLSVLETTPPELVAAAARAGFDAVGMRLLPARATDVAHPVVGDTPMRRETLSRMQDSGVGVLDIEVVWLGPDMQPASYEAMFETGARLGASRVLAGCTDPDEQRTAANLAALCTMALPYGLSIDIEFIKWMELKSLAAALRVLALADQPNAGVLIDCLHAVRAGVTADEIARIDTRRLGYFQLCDAPREPPENGDLAFEARFARLPPGEGGLPLQELIAALPRDLPASVETPLAGRAGALPPAERAGFLLAAARRVLAIEA